MISVLPVERSEARLSHRHKQIDLVAYRLVATETP